MNDQNFLQNAAIEELLKSVKFMIQNALKRTTVVYDGLIVSNNNDGRWNVKYNGETHPIKVYGEIAPIVGSVVKVIIPQGNQALAWFFLPEENEVDPTQGVFIPSVSNNGIISWTNDVGLPNPPPVNIKGPQGENGQDGKDGKDGPYFTPSVSSNGDLSWTNNGNLLNPETVNIKGPQGQQGIQGIQGIQGLQGVQGETGPYFIPSVDNEGNLSWTNNGGLDNPSTVNIKGPQGTQGQPGIQGPPGQNGSDGANGKDGATFTPSVSSSGVLSWTNDKGLPNPTAVNIKGPQGNDGQQGEQGAPGPAGQSAYSAAIEGGYSGTQTEFYQDLANISKAIDKVIPSSPGNFASLTADGNIADSGKNASSFDVAGSANSVQQNLTAHINNTNNPHKVSYEETGAAPSYTYGTTDLIDGVSPLDSGRLYFVYEE